MMVSEGEEVKSGLAVAGGDVRRRLASVRPTTVQMDVAFPGAGVEEVVLDRIEIEAFFFALVSPLNPNSTARTPARPPVKVKTMAPLSRHRSAVLRAPSAAT